MAKIATDFEKIINQGRERKKNEALAARIFSKDGRRSSAPGKSSPGPSLASRVGVKKRVSSAARIPAGDINGEWTHDLHASHSRPPKNAQPQKPAPNSLAARIHAPGTTLPKTRANPPATKASNNRAAKLASALSHATANSQSQNTVNIMPGRTGITIRGLAGPFAVLAQNFAPGTTAADIESAMTPVGGIIQSCRLVKTTPIVIAEIMFESREGADAVISTFNNQTADGRLLHVYLKPLGAPSQPIAARTNANEKRTGNNSVLVDGSNGFGDQMEMDDVAKNDNNSRPGGGLYSDRLVPNKTNNANGGSGRRGRGFRNGR